MTSKLDQITWTTLNSVVQLSLCILFSESAGLSSWRKHHSLVHPENKDSSWSETSKQMNSRYFLELQTLLHGLWKQMSVGAASCELLSLQEQTAPPQFDIYY